MKCAKCGGPTRVVETRAIEVDLSTRRRRACVNGLCGHRSWTIELHEAATGQARSQARVHAATLRTRWARRLRDRSIAARLHLGWQRLATEYGLTKAAVYEAARRGRNA